MKALTSTIRIILIAAFLFLTGINGIKAQNQTSQQTYAFNKTEALVVNEFIFIKFLVSENAENVVYVLQRSEDGKNFTDIYLKKRVCIASKYAFTLLLQRYFSGNINLLLSCKTCGQ